MPGWYADGFYANTTIGDLLRSTRSRGRVVFSSTEGSLELDIEDIRRRAARLATGLAENGLRAGDTIGIQAPTSADSMALAAAAWIVGAVVLPIVDIYGPHELSFILRQSNARFIATPTRWRGRDYVAELLAWEHCPCDAVIAIGDGAPQGSIPLGSLEAAEAFGGPSTAGADDVALLVYTSGTTADPKGVQHTHNTILAGGLRDLPEDASAPTVLSTFPAGHIAGVLGGLGPLLRGGTTVIMDRWSASRAAALIEQYGVKSSSGTPFHLTTLLDEAERSGRDISSLKAFLTGAAAVPPSVLERATRAGIISWRTYGSTEHPVISAGRPDHAEEQRHLTDGELVRGVEIRIVGDDGADLPLGSDGEIVVRGPKQFIGYRDSALDASAFVDGAWFQTGDIGRLDADNHVTITDRKKDVIIRGGENISSKEVEDLLSRHGAVSEAAVCAAPDAVFGELVCAFVVLRPNATLTLDDVRNYFSVLGAAAQKTPARLEIVADLPRTPSGKVRKVELRRIAADG
ncbi:MAG: fadK [Acidimicrobiales bacterium]|nr:fadK [Acidimicrobiales bacterium]